MTRINPFLGKKHTESAKKKIKENHVGMSGKKHSTETKHKMSVSHSNRVWIHKDMSTKSVPVEQLSDFLDAGWTKGRSMDKRASKKYLMSLFDY